MNQAQKLFRVSQLLSRFREQVSILNANGEFTINLHAENILIKVLNEVYGWNLENVNYTERRNYPAIDLRDKAARVAVQVTATSSQEKQNATMYKFIDNGFDEYYDKLYLFIITDKHAKGKRQRTHTWEVLDKTDIYRELNAQNDMDQIERVTKLLEAQFADAAAVDKWQQYCKGLSSYDQFVHNLYNFMDIKGFSPKINNTLVKINLENIYVPLELKMEKFTYINRKEEKTYYIEEALEEFSKLVILGDPGSGKSTILKYLAYNICSNRARKPQYAELVPVFIKGSEYAKFLSTSAKGLGEFIIDQLDRKYEQLFAEKLERDQLIVLIDGIDEINKIKLRHDVVNRINAFIAQYPNIRIIVTSRIVGYKEAKLNSHFYHLEVGKFESDQIRQFARNWYASIASNSDSERSVNLKAEALFAAIWQNKSVYEMAASPLLITIIALIHYQGNTLPEKRVALYEVATSTFLENWVRQREVNKTSNFDKEMLIEMLSPISFHIHRNYATGLISETELKALLLLEYRKINPRLTPKEEKSDVKDIIEFLREDAGFLFEKGRNDQGESMFGFVHQTFQEYFAAIEFVARWKEGAFKENLHVFVFSSNWREVITLAASIFRLNDNTRIGRQNASNFIKDILYVKDPCPELSRPIIIAMEILENDVEVEFSLIMEIMDTAFEGMLKDEETLAEANSYKSPTFISPVMIGLHDMKQFRYYLDEKYLAAVKNIKTPAAIVSTGMLHLIQRSDLPTIKSELVKILRSKNNALKWRIFNYHTVLPVVGIIKTKAFRDEIVKYINSAEFTASYNGYLPAQYCFGINRHERDKSGSKDAIIANWIEQQISSIQQLNSERMRMDLISSHVTDKGVSEQASIIRYLNRVKEEFPELDVSSIEKKNAAEVLFESYGFHKFPFVRFESVSVHSVKGCRTRFAFVDPSLAVNILEYPFTDIDLQPYFSAETTQIQRLFSIIITAFNKPNGDVSVACMEDFLLFIKHYDKIGLGALTLDTSKVFNFGLDCVVDDENVAQSAILNWLKKPGTFHLQKFKVHKKFAGEKYKALLNASGLAPNDKLFILHLIGGKTDYEHLIAATIDEFHGATTIGERRSIKELLYKVLE